MKIETITIREYLTNKGIAFKEQNGELITRCLFSECDADSKNNEAHLYFDPKTGQYDCKKCGEKGNLITLVGHLGDSTDDIALHPRKRRRGTREYPKFGPSLVEECHQAVTDHIRQYLNGRGITDPIIEEYKLGWGKFYGKWWITIPIKDIYGNFVFFKLRQDPDKGNDKITYPKGVQAQIYDWQTLQDVTDELVICEGEPDRLLLMSKGIAAITSTHGAKTFKEEWVEAVQKWPKVYVCYDNGEVGEKGAKRVLEMVGNAPDHETYKISLPKELGEGGDIIDYFTKLNGNPDALFNKYAREYPERIDTSRFSPLSSQELIEILGLTIKKDEENKLITFLCQLAAYTESCQFNISFNAPSSTGKSYIPTEIARLFPEEDVIEIAYCSPTAFFHDVGEYDKEKKGYVVDLSRKILIFLDQPHTQLLERLRPLLSHDKKEISLKITDKTQKYGLKTKNVLLRGYPSVIFCTARLKVDEQEATRFLLLSPETSQEKIREAIHKKIKKETDADTYQEELNNDPARKLLKERIEAIKQENIKEIKIGSPEKIEDRFLEKDKMLKPRDSRDIGRIISLVKCFALLNLWFRKREESTITASRDDIEEACKIWDEISESQELDLPPYIYNLHYEVILSAWNEKNENRSEEFEQITGESGLTRQDIVQKHYQVYGRFMRDWELRQEIIPMLKTAGLIRQERDPDDKRRMLIYPAASFNISKRAKQ